MKRLKFIDYLKGYSIFTIVLLHYMSGLNPEPVVKNLISFGGTGVHLFVLLSGFGLYLSYLNRPVSLPVFFKKRFMRLYIPYILIVLLSALISLFLPVFHNSLYALGGHVFLYKMFDESIMGSYGYPFWFISMIIQFYFVFYLLVKIKDRVNNDVYFFAAGLILSLSWSLLVILLDKASMRVWNSFFLQYLWEFLAGMVIADRVYKSSGKFNHTIKNIHFLVIGLLSTAAYGLLALKGGLAGKMLNDVFALTGYAFLAIWIYRLNIGYINQFFVFYGNISLTVYLLHILVLYTVAELIKPVGIPLPVSTLVAFVLLIPLSMLYQTFINVLLKSRKKHK